MTRASVTVVTPPASEPVGLDEMKLFLRLDGDEENMLILEMVAAARAMAEQYLRRCLITQTLRLTLDTFPRLRPRGDTWWDGVREGAISLVQGDYAPIPLPLPPVQAVGGIVTYSEAGTPQTLSTALYGVDTAGARVYLKQDQTWPSDLRERAAIEITYTAGYGNSAAHVPAPIRLALKQAVAAFYHSRDCSALPAASVALLTPYRVMGQG